MTIRDPFPAADLPTRRAFVQNVARTALGVGILPLALHARAPDLLPTTTGGIRPRARNVIHLFFRGGLSQLDTFDPKPGAATQGPVQALRTSADGIQVSQYFPFLARQMDKVCVLNSMTSTQGAHAQGQYFMRTGQELRGTIQHPSLGAWANYLAGTLNPTLPGHVTVGGGNLVTAGFLPPRFAALPIGDPSQGLQNAALPQGVDEDAFRRRLQQLEQMNQAFAQRHATRDVEAYAGTYADAVKLMRSADLTAFDIDLEDRAMHAAYGVGAFGQGCLLARRLVEHGVRFVEVVSDGWDTHNQNFDELEDKCPPVDRALAALLADLDARGLLGETLVVLSTEFGRTPEITANNGRNHFPKAFTCLLAGGGVRGGMRYGSTTADGREIAEHPVTIPDLHATVATALGLPLDQVVHSPSGRPFKVGDKGVPIAAILA